MTKPRVKQKSSEQARKAWEKQEAFRDNPTSFRHHLSVKGNHTSAPSTYFQDRSVTLRAPRARTFKRESTESASLAFVHITQNQYLCRWLPYAQLKLPMYYISKRIEIAYSHQLKLDYESKCTRPHGHNGIVTVYCCAEELNEYGMVVDFTHVKQRVQDKLDHRNVNEILDFNTTAENMARWICDQIPNAYKVSFQESEGNVAVYVKPGFEDAAL